VLPALPVQDWRVLDDASQTEAIAAAATPGFQPDTGQIAALVAFLGTLTDPVAISGRLGVPAAVPSGLPVPNP